MKKKMMIAGLVIGVLLLVFLIFKPKSFDKKADQILSNLTSYTLKGEMELNKGEDIKNYIVEIDYKKAEEQEYFKVSLFDKNINQEQVLLRNKEGVFVVTPSLNQVFRFEGEWPMNSPKPYLLQTMLQVLQQENTTTEKTKEGTLVKSPVSYPNNPKYQIQEMLFDKEAKPISIHIYDQDHTVQLQLVFSSVEFNNEIEDENFDSPQELESTVSSSMIALADLPLYPVQVFESQLSNANTYQVNGEIRHILEYKGDRSFTLVQTLKKVQEKTETVFKSGEMIDAIELVGFYDGTSCSSYLQNVELTIYSQDLDVEEMMSVLASLQVAVMK